MDLVRHIHEPDVLLEHAFDVHIVLIIFFKF